MLEIELLEPAPTPLGLELAQGVKKSFAAGASTPLSVVSVGGPVFCALTPESAKDQQDLAAYLKQRKQTHRFFVLQLSCTFTPSEGECFVRAWVQVKLDSPDAASEAQPIAWSMEPELLSSPCELTQRAKVSSDAKLIGGEVEASEKLTVQRVHLRKQNELQSNPTWEITRLDGVDINGSYRFRLIVQTPLSGAVGVLGVTAELERKRWVLAPTEN